MTKTKEELIQYLTNQLVDDKELQKYLEQKMSERYPDLDPETFETDEVAEYKFYSLRNQLLLLIMVTVLSGLGPKD